MKALDEREQLYVEQRLLGFTPWQAASRIKCPTPERDGKAMEQRPHVKRFLEERFAEARSKFDVTRDDVVAGIREGIEVARLTDDAGNIIKGWSEIARICGLVAPEKREVKIETDKPLALEQLKAVPDTVLLKLIGKQRELEILDADYTVEETEAGVADETLLDGGEAGAVREAEGQAPVGLFDVRDGEETAELPDAGWDELPQAATARADVHDVRLNSPGRAAQRGFAAKAARRKNGKRGF